MNVGRAASPGRGAAASSDGADRFDAIEGLRAWLAFTVVLYHLLNVTNIDAFYGFTARAEMFGRGAVEVFILISGFVTANLLIYSPQPWFAYIARRAFRLFPAYWLALGLGAIAMVLRLDAFTYMSWADHPSFAADQAAHEANVAAVMSQPVEQTLVHLTLLQGLVPPALSPNQAQSILGPAWSLSLEWQFYLIAPFLLGMMRRPTWALTLVGGTLAIMEILQHAPLFDWISWASLPRYLHLFLLGMLTRLALPHIHGLREYAWVAALAVTGLALEIRTDPAIAVWLGFALLLARRPPKNRGALRAERLFKLAFESRPAAWLGARSYSIYILHSPIIAITSWAVLRLHAFTRIEAFLLIGAISLALTVFASDLTYRHVERPMIARGKRLTARVKKGAAGTLPTAPAV